MLSRTVAVVMAVCLIAAPAAAEPPEGTRQLTIDGHAGVWLPEDVFRAMAIDARRGRLLGEVLELDGELIAASRALLDLAERRATVAETALGDARLSIVDLESQLEAERRRAGHWSRAPALWLAVGVAIAAGALAALGAAR